MIYLRPLWTTFEDQRVPHDILLQTISSVASTDENLRHSLIKRRITWTSARPVLIYAELKLCSYIQKSADYEKIYQRIRSSGLPPGPGGKTLVPSGNDHGRKKWLENFPTETIPNILIIRCSAGGGRPMMRDDSMSKVDFRLSYCPRRNSENVMTQALKSNVRGFLIRRRDVFSPLEGLPCLRHDILHKLHIRDWTRGRELSTFRHFKALRIQYPRSDTCCNRLCNDSELVPRRANRVSSCKDASS